MGPTYLRERRVAAGLTQSQLSERTGIPQPNISDYENGRRVPSAETFSRIVSSTRRSPDDLLREHRAEVLDVIRSHHGMDALVFGSVARGDATPDSDLDLLVTFDGEASRGMERFGDYERIREELEELLGCRVDVIDAGGLKRGRHDEVLAEARPL